MKKFFVKKRVKQIICLHKVSHINYSVSEISTSFLDCIAIETFVHQRVLGTHFLTQKQPFNKTVNEVHSSLRFIMHFAILNLSRYVHSSFKM